MFIMGCIVCVLLKYRNSVVLYNVLIVVVNFFNVLLWGRLRVNKLEREFLKIINLYILRDSWF